MSIRAKREQFHSKIRNAAKEAYFSSVRKQLVIENEASKQIRNIDYIQQIISCNNLQVALSKITLQLEKDQLLSRTLILQMLDRGVFVVLIKILQRGFNEKSIQLTNLPKLPFSFMTVKECLNLICKIVSHDKISVGSNLANKGLLQLVIKYLHQPQLFSICCHILGNLAIQDINFAQKFLATRSYKQILNVIVNMLRSISFEQLQKLKQKQEVSFQNNYFQTDNDFLKALKVALWAITNFLRVQDLKQYQNQSQELLQFAIDFILPTKILTGNVIQLIYEVGYSLKDLLLQKIMNCQDNDGHIKVSVFSKCFNQLMVEAKQKTVNLKQIFYTIDLISKIIFQKAENNNEIMTQEKYAQFKIENTIGIQYVFFFDLMTIPSPFMTKNLISLQRLSSFQFIKKIFCQKSGDQIIKTWWENIAGMIQTNQQKIRLVKICRNLEIQGQWILRLIGDLLHPHASADQKIKALLYIHQLLIKKNGSNSRLTIVTFKKHGIFKYLYALANGQQKNQCVNQKSQQLIQILEMLDHESRV